MNAVDKKSVSKDQDGLVVEEHLSGFIRNGEILRTAEVVVGECEDREQTPEVGTSPNPQAK
jgi:molecular chaperone GrpE (heat shock protein)